MVINIEKFIIKLRKIKEDLALKIFYTKGKGFFDLIQLNKIFELFEKYLIMISKIFDKILEINIINRLDNKINKIK